MKKVILAVLLTAFALFLILPSLSWAQEDLYKAKVLRLPRRGRKRHRRRQEDGSSGVFVRHRAEGVERRSG